ncbi:hypothetical protein [Thiosocius teredinicola]|uniref:hypothetical protein n=1 Tax=Thiosocius teredinicola TaxID=1973002 RepID=UPI0009913C2F
MDMKHPHPQGAPAQPDAQQAPPNDPGYAANPWQQHHAPYHPGWAMPYYGYPSAYMPPSPGMAGPMPYQLPPQMPGIDPSAAQAANAGSANADGFAAALGNMADSSGLGMLKNLFNLDDSDFWKGALVGAAAMLLISNEGLRDSLIGGVAKTAEAMKSGLGGLGDDDTDNEQTTGEHTTDEEEQPA